LFWYCDVAEQELAKQKADPRSKEHRETNKRLSQINEERVSSVEIRP